MLPLGADAEKRKFMTQKKQERRESISTEFKGQTHIGTLTVSGTRKLSFTVEYRGRKFSDGRTWGTDSEEQHNMRVIAETILLELVADAERE